MAFGFIGLKDTSFPHEQNEKLTIKKHTQMNFFLIKASVHSKLPQHFALAAMI